MEPTFTIKDMLSVSHSFSRNPVQSFSMLLSSTRLEAEQLQDILNYLLDRYLISEYSENGQKVIFCSIQVNYLYQSDEMLILRQLLASKQSIDDKILETSKKEAYKLENEIHNIKNKINNHPVLSQNQSPPKSCTADWESSLSPEQAFSVKTTRKEISNIEADISKYTDIIRRLLGDLTDTFNCSHREVLQKLGVNRSIQSILLGPP